MRNAAIPLVLLCLAGCGRSGIPHQEALRTVAVIDGLSVNAEVERDAVTGCEWLVFEKNGVTAQPRMEVGPDGGRRQRCVTSEGRPAGQPSGYGRTVRPVADIPPAGNDHTPGGTTIPAEPAATEGIPPPGPQDTTAATAANDVPAAPSAQDSALSQALADPQPEGR